MVEWYILTGVVAAVIGSFLNVVIYRLPIMMQAQWKQECHELFGGQITEKATDKPAFNLSFPNSHCPHCKAHLPLYCNIPLLSYLFLRGKCHACKTPIPFRYFLVELTSVVLSLTVLFQFGVTTKTVAALILTWGLIGLSFIDIKHYFLPDSITLSLLWIGLYCATMHLFLITPSQAIYGALIGYLFLWVIAKLYALTRKQEGMGLGDCKMLALFGAWTGPLAILNVVLISAILALIVSLILMCFHKFKKGQYIPFGPYLAIAGWWTVVFGPQLNHLMFRLMS